MADRTKWAGLGVTSIVLGLASGQAWAAAPDTVATESEGIAKASAVSPRSAALAELLWGPEDARYCIALPETRQVMLDVKFVTTGRVSYQEIGWESAGLGTLATGAGDVAFLESDDELVGFGSVLDVRWRCPCLDDDETISNGYGFVNLSGNWLSGDADGEKPNASGDNFALTYFENSPGGFTGINFGDTAASAEFDVDQYVLGFTIGAGRVVQLNENTDVDLRFGLFARHSDTMYDGWASSITFPNNMIAYEYDIDELNIGLSVGAEFTYYVDDSPFNFFAGIQGGVYYAEAELDADMHVMVPVNPTVADRAFSQSVDDDEDYWAASLDLRVGVGYRRDNFSAELFLGYNYRSDVATLDSKDSPLDSGPGIDRNDIDGFIIGAGISIGF